MYDHILVRLLYDVELLQNMFQNNFVKLSQMITTLLHVHICHKSKYNDFFSIIIIHATKYQSYQPFLQPVY